MKRLMGFVILIAIAGCFSCATTVFAHGDGGDSDTQNGSQNTGINGNNPYRSASSGVTFDRDPEYVFMNWYHTQRIEEDRTWLTYIQRFEATVDMSTLLANTSVTGYTLYCWKIGKAGIFFPISLVWQTSKLGSRAFYGVVTGNMNTVQRLNEKTWSGRRANQLMHFFSGEVQANMLARREERVRAQREAAASSSTSDIPGGNR